MNTETVKPENVSYWVKFGDTGSDYTDRWLCKKCGNTCRTDSWGKKCEYEYCPHCGSKMEVVNI